MVVFFFNDTATTEIYTLSLHDALPICRVDLRLGVAATALDRDARLVHTSDGTAERYDELVLATGSRAWTPRSEEHTSELQSRQYLVCRLLLEKKNSMHINHMIHVYIIK